MENKKTTKKNVKKTTTAVKTENKKEVNKGTVNKFTIYGFIALVFLCLLFFLLGKTLFDIGKETNKPAEISEVDEIVINSETNSVTISQGQKSKISLDFEYNDFDEVIWYIDDENVVKFEDGYLVGVNDGVTNVRITDDNQFEIYFQVNVISFNKTNAIASPTGIGLSKATLALNIGESSKLNAVVFPDSASQKVKWSSTDEEIASVDSNGNVTGISMGTTSIYATTDNGISINCEVTVN